MNCVKNLTKLLRKLSDPVEEFSFDNKHLVAILWSFPPENNDVSSGL